MAPQTKTITYDVQRGWAPEWGWHWLIIDTDTRENVGLLFEKDRTLEMTFDIARAPVKRVRQMLACDLCQKDCRRRVRCFRCENRTCYGDCSPRNGMPCASCREDVPRNNAR